MKRRVGALVSVDFLAEWFKSNTAEPVWSLCVDSVAAPYRHKESFIKKIKKLNRSDAGNLTHYLGFFPGVVFTDGSVCHSSFVHGRKRKNRNFCLYSF